MKKLRGFSGVEAFLIVLVLVIAGAVGYVFFMNTSGNKATTTTSSVPTTIQQITSTSDIDKVTTELNSLNVESDSTSDLDSLTTQLNSF